MAVIMKVLLTNDDGIQSVGLKIVAEWAQKHFDEVVVCAPKTQQSGKSHAINIHQPIEITHIDYCVPNIRAYSVDSTPVDCVRYATLGLKEHYDLIISGINKGYNLGEDILYSGTVGAIFETSLRGMRGIALSTEYTSFQTAEAWLESVYRFFVDNKLFDYNDTYNVNIPLETKGILTTKMGGAYYTDDFIAADETHFHQEGYMVYRFGSDLTIDTDATMNGYISVTPLSIKRDNPEAYRRIAKNIG